ncbi:MAG TPA: hydrogenase maturation protease [Bauldia sp.]|nr:hydrogenase maturation protease [Bauldia sp.]
MATRVIGIGHPDRGDDAVGRVVAARLMGMPGIEVIETDGEAAKLLDLMEGADCVIIADAALSGASPGAVRRLDAAAQPVPQPMFAASSHAVGLAESIELARILDRLPRRCIIFAIEAQDFTLGAGLSPVVAAAVDRVVGAILGEIGVWVDA